MGASESLWWRDICPKIPSYRITDVAKAIHPHLEHKVVVIRPGEKIHEEMITEADSFNTIDLGKYFAILPSDGSKRMTPTHSLYQYGKG